MPPADVPPPPSPVARVRAALSALGGGHEVVEFAVSTATAEEAAAAVGCQIGQIIKSLFFMAEGRPTLVLVAGDRQVDTARLAALLGIGRKKLRLGSPDDVFAATGFHVGGVSPVGLTGQCDVVVDESLRRFDRTWAAAGAENAVFAIDPARLVELTGGQWAAITKDVP
jgi:Cys-tRNA(Pro) deacylase